MKKRHLRKSIETALVIISSILFITLCMINDFELKAIPYIVIAISIIIINCKIIGKYGRKEFLEKE